MICAKYAPSIPSSNFTALTRLDQNRAVAQLSGKMNRGVHDLKNVIIWGNHSLTQYPDVSISKLDNKSLSSVINDEKWLKGNFISDVAKRGAAIIAARKLSSAASAASAVCDHVHDWLIGTNDGEVVSMAVMTDGKSYGVKAGLCYSMPVTCKNG
jgi:malate/lactate dehydrogenase